MTEGLFLNCVSKLWILSVSEFHVASNHGICLILVLIVHLTIIECQQLNQHKLNGLML